MICEGLYLLHQEDTKKDSNKSNNVGWNEEIQKQSVDNDRKRRAQAAAERKAKVMAQMNQMQKKFADSHKGELAKMEVVTGESGKPSQGSGAGAIRSSPRRKSLKAIGNVQL